MLMHEGLFDVAEHLDPQGPGPRHHLDHLDRLIVTAIRRGHVA